MIASKYVVLILMVKSLSTLNNIVVIKKNGEISNYLRSEVNDIWNATNQLSSNNNQSFYDKRVDLSDCLVRASCSVSIFFKENFITLLQLGKKSARVTKNTSKYIICV